jgi:hypothetical protein
MTGRIAYRLLKRKLSGLAERGTNLPRDIGGLNSLQSVVSRLSLLIIMLGVGFVVEENKIFFCFPKGSVSLFLLET